MKLSEWIKTKKELWQDDRKPDYYLLFLASFLMMLGMIFSYSLSIFTVDYFDYNQFHFFIRQAFVVIISLFIMWVFAHIKPSVIFNDWRLGWKIFGWSLFLMIIMNFLPPSLVTESGGATRWIKLPGLSIAPVEFVKIGFIYYLSWSFHRRFTELDKVSLKNEVALILPYYVILGILALFIAVLQKDLGNTVLLAVIMLFMMYFADRSKKIITLIILISMTAFGVLIAIAPHRIGRIKSWWSSVQDSYLPLFPSWIQDAMRVENFDEPGQVSNSINAIYNGGYFGQGLAEGNMKLGFLPEVHTDFVLAGIMEEVGFFRFLFILGLIAIILIRIFKISRRVNNQVYHFFTLGVALMISVSFIINAFGITGMIPIKGIAVPFLSYGGSSILALGLAIGMVLSISKEVDNDKRLDTQQKETRWVK